MHLSADWAYALGGLAVVLVATPLCVVALRDAKRLRGGGLGAGLGELHRFLDPSRQHIRAVAAEAVKERRDDEPVAWLTVPGRWGASGSR